MKHKRTKWDRIAWTPFQPCVVDAADYPAADMAPESIWRNSRYQVARWFGEAPEPFGRYVHLSLKVHDKQAHHDWRDMQRIKNELVGTECEAVELYPAESRLVDCANQYHLFVFQPGCRFPFGFTSRLVSADTTGTNARQRPFDEAPAEFATVSAHAPAGPPERDTMSRAFDNLVAQTWNTIEDADPDISTERLMAMTVERVSAETGRDIDSGDISAALQRHEMARQKGTP